MKRIVSIAVAAVAIGAFGLNSEAAFAAKNDAYAHKKAECKHEAKAKVLRTVSRLERVLLRIGRICQRPRR
jgi:hypothetical protein